MQSCGKRKWDNGRIEEDPGDTEGWRNPGVFKNGRDTNSPGNPGGSVESGFPGIGREDDFR